jgi:hypothetical protein
VKVRAFMLADAVDTGPGGKLFVHGGGISRIRPPVGYPWTQPQLAVLLILEREGEPVGSDHEIQLRIVDANGETLGPELPVNFRFPPPVAEEAPTLVNLSATIAGLTFEAPGIYSVEARVDGELIDRLRLVLVEAAEKLKGPTEPEPSG